MAHELNDPLTALLLYLHSIKDGAEASSSESAAPEARSRMIDMALEAEHICAIVERMGRSREAPTDVVAIALGREAIDIWQGNQPGRRRGLCIAFFQPDHFDAARARGAQPDR